MPRHWIAGLVAASFGLCGANACDTWQLVASPHPDVLYAVPTADKVVSLTIDDGPDPVTTPRILEVLAEYGASATFFVIADRIPGNEALADSIVAAGHELANHMTRDETSVDLEPEIFERELLRAQEILAPWGGATWFRPGGGWYDDWMLDVLDRHGYRCALGWDYPLDAQIPSSRFASWFVLRRARPGAVIILHDGGERGLRTVETLERALPILAQRGYRVLNLSQLAALADPPG